MIHGAGIARIAIPVADLGEARMSWTRLGFALGPRVTEPGSGRAFETILFRRGALALTSAEFEIEIDTPGLEDGETVLRQIELPEGSVALHERRRAVADAAFLWRETPPSPPMRPEWLAHPNGAAVLAGVFAVVSDTQGLAERWERALGPAAVTTTDDVVTLRVGTQTIIFAGIEDALAMYPDAEDFAAVVRIHVEDLTRAADVLAAWQIDFDESTGSLLVPPDEATGVLLELIGPR